MSASETPSVVQSSSTGNNARAVIETAKPAPTSDEAAQCFKYYGQYDESGVDVSLIRWMLSLTPRQRLEFMEQSARDTLKLQEYGRRHRETKAAANR